MNVNKDYAKLMGMVQQVKDQYMKLGFYCGDVVSLKSSHAQSFWAQCIRVGDKKFELKLTDILLSTDENSIRDTIAHEMLHTISGCMNHGEKFKLIARHMNQIYGYNIKRGNSAEEKNVVLNREKHYHYEVVCTCCNKVVYKAQRKSKMINNISNYQHKGCGGRLVVRAI